MKRETIILTVLLLTHHNIFADNNDKFHSRQVVKKVVDKSRKQIIGENHITDKEEALFDMKTKNLFDYNTLLYTTPFAVKYNLTRWRKIQKLDVKTLDLYTCKQKHLYKIQDLGNEGTAVKFLYPHINPYPGRTSGYDVFDIYKVKALERRFYDTHGPLFDANIVFGNYGTYLFQLLGAQSINKNWHVSFTLDSLLSDKEYVHSEKHDWQVVTYPLSLNFHYKNDDETYLAFFSFYRKKHNVRESGGISLNFETVDKKAERNYATWLINSGVSNNIYPEDQVFSENFVTEYFFYHQYEISPSFQIFNELKWNEDINTFKIKVLPDLIEDSQSKYPQKTKKTLRYLSGKNIDNILGFEPFSDKNKFLSRYCEVGIKGDLARIFYELHYKLNFIENFFVYKKTKLNQRKDHEKEWLENFVGGMFRFNISNENSVFVQGDVVLDKEKCFAVQGGYEGRFGILKYILSRHCPDLLSQFYKSSQSFLRNWNNENFEIQQDQQVIYEGNLDFSIFTLRPMFSFLLQKNPIFYKKDPNEAVISATCKPIQEKESKSLFVGGLLGIKVFNDYHWDVDIVKSIFEKKNIPSWKITTRLYYLHEFEEKRGEFTCGVEFNWNTPYFGDAYDPVIQKFYSQDFFEMYSYPLLGVYLNMRISKFRIFIKVINILQYVNKEKTSYYASPFYPGQKRILDFGVSWSIFN